MTVDQVSSSNPSRRVGRSRAVLAGAALVLVITAVACRPIPLGSAGATIGNDVSNPACAQFQPVPTAPCGPQPQLWAAIQGPYELFENGDPFATKCARGTASASAATCTGGTYPGGATNPSYDPTGYEYAIDVAAQDIGKPVTFQVWDAGQYLRTTGTPGSNRSIPVARTAGSTTITRSSGTATFSNADVGESITATGIPANAVITGFVSATSVQISDAATSSGTATASISSTPDCRTDQSPFTAPPYLQQPITNQGCQTGDSTGAGTAAPLQVQIFDNDGNDLTVDYTAPISGCHLYVPPNADAGLYRNTWTSVCTFTPTKVGIYPVRVKSSGIVLPNGTVLTDVGAGWNAFSLRLTGAAATSLYAVDASSIWANSPGLGRTYLAEIGSDAAGKTLVIDLFDVGDASGTGDYAVQVQGPPAGAPSVVPITGETVPAPNLASSCRYNPNASATQGPDVSGAGGADAANCRVVTRSGGTNRYNNGWLRIQLQIAETYSCELDCWWTVRYDIGGSLTLNDRTVWKVVVADLAGVPSTTTTSTAPEPTTTTTTAPPVPLGSPRSGPELTPVPSA